MTTLKHIYLKRARERRYAFTATPAPKHRPIPTRIAVVLWGSLVASVVCIILGGIAL